MTQTLLIIDASLQGVAVAIANAGATGERVLWQALHLQTAGAVAALPGLVVRGLRAIGLEAPAAGRPWPLAGIVVGAGPGSFTGIKAGLAFAYGLRTATKTPLLGLGALEEAARILVSRPDVEDDLALFLPATRTHGYWTRATRGQGPAPAAMIEVGPAVERLVATLAPQTRLRIAGTWPLLASQIHDLNRQSAPLDYEALCQAAICGMAETAAQLWPAGFTDGLVQPRYLRLSTAEERLAGAVHPQTPPL